jgi:hypothetical protein
MPTGLRIQGAEAPVTMRLERPHAEILGQGQGLPVVGFGLFALQRLPARRNVAEEAPGIRLVPVFPVLTGMLQRALGEGLRLLQAAGQQMHLPQGETAAHLKDYHFYCSSLFDRLREERNGVGNASG